MKKMLYIFLLIATASVLSSCSNDSTSPETTSPETPSSEILSSETTSPENETAGSSDEVGSGDDARFISVQTENGSIIYQLNDSAAAESLYQQLPITVESEDFSTNEKIFYPPQELDTDNCPLAAGGSGTLAYYQPWGDVVMFYGNFSENPSLFELGHVISGEELISRLSGTITIDIYQEVQR